MSVNAKLRRAMFAAGYTKEDIAAKVEVSPKTVERWISRGRVPYPVHQYAVATVLGVDESELWPDAVSADQQSQRSAQVVALRDHRAADTQTETVSHESVTGEHEPPPGHWTSEVPEGWRRVMETNSYGARYWCLEQEDRRASTAHTAVDSDQHQAGNSMQELMSWVPSGNREAAERKPIPGHAFAGLINGHDREGWER